MDPVMSTAIMEAAKLALQVYFINLRMAGKTAEEIETMFLQSKAEFDKNRPEFLPDV